MRVLSYDGGLSAEVWGVVDETPRWRMGEPSSGRLWEDVVAGSLGPQGGAVILDGGATQEVVVLAADGSVEAVFGGPGSAPGEYTSLGAVSLDQATGAILVEDEGALRLVALSPAGDVVATADASGLGAASLKSFREGHFTAGPPPRTVRGGRRYATPWGHAPLVRGTLVPLSIDTIASVPWDKSLSFGGNDPFSPRGFSIDVGDRMVSMRGDVPELRWFAPDSGLAQVVRWPATASAVTDSAWQDYATGWSEFAGRRMPTASVVEQLRVIRESLSGVLPLYSDLLFDGENIWVGSYAAENYHRPAEAGRVFLVFDSSGLYLGEVRVPRRIVRVLDVRNGGLLGLVRDELGVERVEMLGLGPPGSGREVDRR